MEELNSIKDEELSAKELNIISLYQRFCNFKELSNDMMKTLIKAIYIYPYKRVEIHWNFKEEASYANVGERE